MKKLAFLVLALAGLTAFAATCRVLNVSLEEIDGDATFAGELKNETTVDILGHKFVVAFLDNDGNVIETKTVDGCLRSLQANSSDFFSAADTADDPDDVEVGLARLALDSTLKLGQTVNGDLTITDVEASRDGEDLTVSGNIKNDDDDDLEDVRACVVVFDDDGKVVVTLRDGDTEDLLSDEDYDFEITGKVPDDDNLVDNVSIWADATNADEDDDPTDPVEFDDVTVDEGTVTPSPTGTATNTPTATPTP